MAIKSLLLDAAYRDGSLWLAATSACKPPGDKKTRSCLRFIQIETASTAVVQDFNFGLSGTYYITTIQQLGLMETETWRCSTGPRRPSLPLCTPVGARSATL